MLLAVHYGYSSPKELQAFAAEFDIAPADARKAVQWLFDHGAIDREKNDPGPKTPKYIEFVWHYVPKDRVQALLNRLGKLGVERVAGEGYGAEIGR